MLAQVRTQLQTNTMTPATAFQTYSVTVPHGIRPGMPFQFSTPSGMMQIVCPDHAAEGSTIDVEAPIVVASTVVTPDVQSATQMTTVSLSGAQPAPVSQNIKRSGGYIPGVRPGRKTADYIDAVLSRLTLVGALYVWPGSACCP